MLDSVATRYGSREAMVFGEVRVSFAEFRERANRLARGLAALGIRHGENVAIWLPNRPEWFFAQYACARLGAVVIALNPRYKAHELSYVLGQSEAKALLITDHLGGIDYFETLHEVLPELPASVLGELTSARFPELRHVIVDADDPYPGCHRLADVVDLGAGSGAAGGSRASTRRLASRCASSILRRARSANPARRGNCSSGASASRAVITINRKRLRQPSRQTAGSALATSASRTAKGTRSSRAGSARRSASVTSWSRPVRSRRSSCRTRTYGKRSSWAFPIRSSTRRPWPM